MRILKTSNNFAKFFEIITHILPNATIGDIKFLKKNGIIKIGAPICKGKILVGKLKVIKNQTNIQKLLNNIFHKNLIKDNSLRTNSENNGIIQSISTKRKKGTVSISIQIIEKRKIQIGDKIAGRHGNKGIIAKILNTEDMPYLEDGTPTDILLNPLGIPSRMNVGQIYECLLTLAAKTLNEKYKLLPFDEQQLTKKNVISINIIYIKLNEARKKSKKKWLFNPTYPGKFHLIDGITGSLFEKPILVGYAYILKLMHMVDDKINSRLTGPYTMVLKQPVRGKARNGGQRLGEMEVWAIEGFGAAYTLQEMLTLKSDDLTNRPKLLYNLINNVKLPKPEIPESFKTLIIELQCLCININLFEK